MIDGIISSADKKTLTTLTVRPDNVFLTDGILREPGLIENMAQTAAAGISFSPSGEETVPRTGYIGAIRDLNIGRLPEVGSTITTTVEVTHEIFNATVVNAFISMEGEKIAECELRIFLAPS